MERDRLTALLESLAVSPEVAGELRHLLADSFDLSELDAAWPAPGRRDDRPALPERYEDRGLLGRGGMGEVRRVYDRVLDRQIALKLVRADLALSAGASARFVAEARATAGLAHPGIVPVYDHGTAPDGRPYFTMQEIRGETFSSLVERLHREGTEDQRTGVRRLVDLLERAAAAVGFAHARGIVHRDLKPDNLLVGEHGEVQVVDWGLFRPDPSWDGPPVLVAAVAGTPRYMAPEQARGDLARIDARTDVYALGCVLWEVLAGFPPFGGLGVAEILGRLANDHTPGRPLTTIPGVDELCDLAERCLRADAALRPAGAGEVARALRRWLDGETRRDRARAALDAARRLADELVELSERAREARAEADRRLAATSPWEPDTTREAWWEADDRAQALERTCRDHDRGIDEALEAALTHDPDATEVRAAAAERALAAHAAAEARGDADAAAVAELRLRRHLEGLPEDQPRRIHALRWLAGTGALTLHTDPPGARVVLHRLELVRRRLVPVPERELGRTPLEAVPLPAGRWLLTIEAEGRPVVRYPVRIGRQEHWDGVPPGGAGPLPIVLPEALAEDERYVPAGWCRIGGDPEAPSGLPALRMWVDGFVARRFVVTNAEYLAFVNDLAARDPALAERVAPRDRGRTVGAWGEVLYGRGEDGRYFLKTDFDGVTWAPDWPVIMVDHVAAWTFARWEAARTGLPWRLPGEVEWEKAARGPDGRIHPWGDLVDPSWCANRLAFRGAGQVEPVTARPVDESPYGLRGMAGGVVEWTASRMAAEGLVDGGRAAIPDGSADGEEAWGGRAAPHRIVGRGGSRVHDLRAARAAFRLAMEPWSRASNVGFRLVRSVGHASTESNGRAVEETEEGP